MSSSADSLLELVWFGIDVISMLSWILVMVSELLFPRLIDSDTGVVCTIPSSSWDDCCCWSMDEVVVCCKGEDCCGGEDDDAVEFISELFAKLYFEVAINWYLLLSTIAPAFDGPFLSGVLLSGDEKIDANLVRNKHDQIDFLLDKNWKFNCTYCMIRYPVYLFVPRRWNHLLRWTRFPLLLLAAFGLAYNEYFWSSVYCWKIQFW